MFEKEAEEYFGNFADCANCKNRWGDCADQLDEYCLENGCCFATPKEQDIYLAGAEPREKRIADLEKENAELKHTIATLRQEKDNVSMHAKAMEVVAKTRSDQLTKAKELLNEFMRISKASDEDFEHDYSELIGETEQFIKDLEK